MALPGAHAASDPSALSTGALAPLRSAAMEGASPGAAAPDGAGARGVPPERGVSLAEGLNAGPGLREALQKAKEDYNMAAGTISSLQRQLEIQESQLRRTTSEKEMLQRKLGERESQLQAMSTKICSLIEEREHEEMMMAIEKENCRLRQVVTEQESKLAEQKQLISELQGTVSQLRAEVLSSRHHIHKQQQAQEEMQSRAEALQHRELQTRVALECITSRFERYRSKIIQATFSTAGSKPPQAEVTDEEVLEAMQKIINERLEFHQMLKQKGVKVPSLYSDPSGSSPASAKGRRKSPARHLSVPEKQP